MVYGPGYGPVYPRPIETQEPKVSRYTVRMVDETGEEHLVTVPARSPNVAMGRARLKCEGDGEIFVMDVWKV
jgi:hypothetical protein